MSQAALILCLMLTAGRADDDLLLSRDVVDLVRHGVPAFQCRWHQAREWSVGGRGSEFYITANGNREYKLSEHGRDGKRVWLQGPSGRFYYITPGGNREYQRR